MTQLTKGMYGSEFAPTGDMFGLCVGQMRGGDGKVTHNSGWYNEAGEKLGWGDLSTDDLRRISAELSEGEVFVLLDERDSFWRFIVTSPGPTHASSDTKLESEAPGVDYVAEHATYVVVRGHVYHVNRYRSADAKDRERDGLLFKVLEPESVKALMLTGRPL